VPIRLTREIRSFAIVGGIGFAIEAMLLTALTQFADWTPLQARVPSFLIAVTTTWWLNRQHTFAGRGLEQRSLEAFFYIAIQVCGALINFAVFGICLHLIPRLAGVPVLPLAIGAAAGFIFNFVASNAVLYSQARARHK
jgi:putative flippase GtrA